MMKLVTSKDTEWILPLAVATVLLLLELFSPFLHSNL